MFIDLGKAYDRVNRIKLWNFLREYEAYERLIKILEARRDSSKAYVKDSLGKLVKIVRR